MTKQLRGPTKGSATAIAEVADGGKPSTYSPREKGEFVQPVRTLQLVQTVGLTEASRRMGISTTTIHKARRTNEISRVMEVAADGLLYRHEHDGKVRDVYAPVTPVGQLVEDTGLVLYLLQVDASKAPLVERFGKMLGAEIMRT